MNHIFTRRTASEFVVMVIGLLLSVGQAQAATIYASGQRLIPAVPGVHDDLRENFIYAIDSSTGIATPVSPETTGLPSALAGTAEPFMISLGSVENQLYGVDLDTDSLIHFNPETGEAAVVGSVGAVTSGDRSIYSGFAALTGVDTNQDGSFDALFGNVNFIDSDNDPDTPSERLGGIARFNLTDGTWELVGTNPGVIFFGFASSPTSVPEPGLLFGIVTVSLLGIWTKRNAKE